MTKNSSTYLNQNLHILNSYRKFHHFTPLKLTSYISNSEQAYICSDNKGNVKYVPFNSIVWG